MSRDAGGAREREEMGRWVRGEFDKWRHTTDEVRAQGFSCTFSGSSAEIGGHVDIHSMCVHNMLHYARVSSSDNSCLFVLTTVQYWSLGREYIIGHHQRPNSDNVYRTLCFLTTRGLSDCC